MRNEPEHTQPGALDLLPTEGEQRSGRGRAGLLRRWQLGAFGLLLAGALVGLGTQMGSGCTSGHGVCGVSRLSPRSIAATLLFLAAGMVTVYFWGHQS